MGQYLSVGIVVKFSVSKKQLTNAALTHEEFEVKIVDKLGYNFSLFNMIEKEEYYTYSLKEGMLKENLLPLLKQVYPILYKNQSSYQTVIEKITAMTEEEIIKYADDMPDECFQLDKYSEKDYISYKNSRISINYGDIIMIAIEGKIAMETYGEIFEFAKRCMVRAFPDSPLASCMRMYITG